MLDATVKYPMIMPDGTVVRSVVQLNQVLDHPRIEVGDFSYYSNFRELEDYAAAIAPYLFPLSLEKLVIGKFVQMAHGTRFITSTANHNMSGFSTYPFNNFTMTSATTREDIQAMFDTPNKKGDTVVGNDVWIGMNATIMPGVTIGDGAIIGACSVVTKDIEPYTIVGGNPATPIRKRFEPRTIDKLLEIRWWDWPQEKILEKVDAIVGADITALCA
ncbi:CatB-related O-acetyltransferase [Pseudodesulfovibrio sp.]|uniref:CatB-related O-acetyltransferase n=1 Tax=unclassified Pseudodesulfovibrio TaxID=2661612 RepID=UPI003B004080